LVDPLEFIVLSGAVRRGYGAVLARLMSMRGNASHGTRLEVAKAVKVSMHLLLLCKRPKGL
jgi:hypothetical protein